MMLCRYCVRRKSVPNIAKKMSVMPRLAAENRGFSNTWSRSIGCVECCSRQANALSTITASVKEPTITGLVQPSVGPWMIAYTSASNPTIESAAPMRSSFGFSGSRDFGSR